jgi:hypothetical protein
MSLEHDTGLDSRSCISGNQTAAAVAAVDVTLQSTFVPFVLSVNL